MGRLEKELDKLSVKEQGSSTKDIKEVTLLLSAPSEDLSVLRTLNLDHQLEKGKKKIEISQKLTILANQYNKKTYTGEQLKKLCLKYDLRLLSSNYYKGKIDEQLASKINEFSKNNKDVHVSSQHFYVLAVRESFSGNRYNASNDEAKTKCLFFYRESPDRNTKDALKAGEKDVFTLIHSWGEEYNTSRESRFLFFDSGTDSASTALTTILSIMIMLGASLFSMKSFTACWITAVIGFLFFTLNALTTKNYDEKWNSAG